MAAADNASSTALFPPGAPDVFYIVDLSGYLFRAYHALPPLSSPTGEPTHAVLGVTTMLLKLIADQQPALLAVAMDSRTRSFRHQLYDQYKANRPSAPEDLRTQVERVRDIVDAYRIPKLERDGMEADDVIATAVRQATGQGLRVVIVSADKDLLQLVSPEVLMYDTGRNKVYGAPETETKLGVGPALVRDYLALVGDSSDNVPGVPSVGPKTASKLLLEFGGLDEIYGQLDRIDKANLRTKLETYRDQAMLSRQLVTLKDDVEVEVQRERLHRGEPDVAALRVTFSELGFSRLLAQLPDEGNPDPALASSTPAALTQIIAGPVTIVRDGAGLQGVAEAMAAAERTTLYSVADGPRPLGQDLVGIAILCEEQAFYIPVGHSDSGQGEQPTREQLAQSLSPALSDPERIKWTADAKREFIAMGQCGIPLVGVGFDVGLASYLIDPDRHGHTLSEVCHELFGEPLAAYAEIAKRPTKSEAPSERPVEVVAELAAAMARATGACVVAQQARIRAPLLKLIKEMELPLSAVLAQMEVAGIAVDVPYLRKLSQEATEELVGLERRCRELAGHDFNVASPRQLETILFDELQLPVIKRTKTARSTDHSVLEELSVIHELPAAILEHRMLAKLKSTYLDALPREVDPHTRRIHTDFRQTVAATGRLSSSDPNLQNIPIRREFGRRIRDAFIPQEGWLLMSADYSQIELRVLAHISQDEALLSAFRSGEDVHVRTARAIFGVPAEQVTKEMRGQAKTVNFAVIYGQTQFALARNLRIERGQASRYIKAFFAQYAGVQRYMDQVVEEGRERGYVETLCGRVRHLPDLQSRNRVKRQAAERVARNAPIQGSAADIIKLAMIAVHRALHEQQLQARMLLTVHDELVLELPPEEREPLDRLVRTGMEQALTLAVPLVVESGFGPSWGKAH